MGIERGEKGVGRRLSGCDDVGQADAAQRRADEGEARMAGERGVERGEALGVAERVARLHVAPAVDGRDGRRAGPRETRAEVGHGRVERLGVAEAGRVGRAQEDAGEVVARRAPCPGACARAS